VDKWKKYITKVLIAKLFYVELGFIAVVRQDKTNGFSKVNAIDDSYLTARLYT